MSQEKRIIILATFILIISNIIIYVLFFNLKWNKINLESLTKKSYEIQRESQTWSKNTNNIQTTWNININNDENLDDLVWTNDLSIFTWSESSVSSSWNSNNSSQNNQITNTIKLLSWTKLFTWINEVNAILWINWKYSLIDSNNIIFTYLWTWEIDLIENINKLGWNLVEIWEKKIIKDNLLIGDRVTYINLPNYKWIKTIFTAKFVDTGDLWLLEIDYNKYYKLKKYLRNLFNY